MSRIFDALQRLDQPGGEGILQRISEERVLQSQIAASVRAAEGARPHADAGTAVPPLASGIRSVALQPTSNAAIRFDGPQSEAAEQYRSMRTKIGQHPSQPRVIVVSSSGPGDGKTTTAVNLAAAMALRENTSVLLVDADFRRSSVAAMLGVPCTPGLVEVLGGACAAEEAIVRIEQSPNLHVLPNGKTHPSPPELLDSAVWPQLVSQLRNSFQFVVIDAPPMTVTDVDLIATACDGLILVARTDHSHLKSVQATIAAVAEEKLIGVVLNQVRDWFLWKSPNPYGYYYSSSTSRG